MRGAWIEIFLAPLCRVIRAGRSPCGERGLKFFPPLDSDRRLVSLPVRGAWIEIHKLSASVFRLLVAPRAGSVD